MRTLPPCWPRTRQAISRNSLTGELKLPGAYPVLPIGHSGRSYAHPLTGR
jgi:hypothetical protein